MRKPTQFEHLAGKVVQFAMVGGGLTIAVERGVTFIRMIYLNERATTPLECVNMLSAIVLGGAATFVGVAALGLGAGWLLYHSGWAILRIFVWASWAANTRPAPTDDWKRDPI